MQQEIILKPFHKSAADFQMHADRGIQHAITMGRMTQEDADLIDEFVITLEAQDNLGEKRVYKIRNGLSNAIRFFKTPLSGNNIPEIYKGFENLKKNSTRLKRLRDGFNEDGTTRTILVDSGKPLSDHTKADYMLFMKRLLLWMIDEGYSDLPKKKVEKIKVVKPNKVTKRADDLISKEEILKMINACSNSRDRALIATLYEGAFRIGEIGAMRWNDLDFSDPHFCTATTDFKTGIERHIPLHMARPYLIQWMNDYPVEPTCNNPVFVTRRKTSLAYQATKKQLNIIAQRAGIARPIKPHCFRHSRITEMIKDGWHETTVKEIAWGNIETSQFKTYTHLTKKDVINEARRQNGIEPTEEQAQTDALKPRQCMRCLTLNTPTDNFCSVCGNPLTEEIAADLKSMREEIHKEPAFMNLIKNLEEKIEALQTIS